MHLQRSAADDTGWHLLSNFQPKITWVQADYVGNHWTYCQNVIGLPLLLYPSFDPRAEDIKKQKRCLAAFGNSRILGWVWMSLRSVTEPPDDALSADTGCDSHHLSLQHQLSQQMGPISASGLSSGTTHMDRLGTSNRTAWDTWRMVQDQCPRAKTWVHFWVLLSSSVQRQRGHADSTDGRSISWLHHTKLLCRGINTTYISDQ